MTKLPLLLSNLQSDALVDSRHAETGAVRPWLVTIGILLPVGAGVLAFALWHDSIDGSKLFPAAAIFAGALTGTVSMLFTRVKDLAAKPKPDVGRDPVVQAAVVFRSALYCAQVAFVLNGVLVIATILKEGLGSQILTCIGIALFVHMGMKVLMLLQGLRSQMLDTAGSRAQAPIPRVMAPRAS